MEHWYLVSGVSGPQSSFHVRGSKGRHGIRLGESVFADDVSGDFHDFEREHGTVLNRSTVFVCPLVRDVLEELVWEVSVGEVEFDAVESGSVADFACSNSVPPYVGLDLFDCQRTRGRAGRRHGDNG